jgi:hypothetical protein
MGDGDWWIALAMDWWHWRFGCESHLLIWCNEVRLSVAIWEPVSVNDCGCLSC